MRKFVVALSILTLVFGIGGVAYAASTYTVKSNGVLQYDGNADGDYADNEDVIFDSNDLVNINNQVSVLKTGMEGYETQLRDISSDVEQLGDDISLLSDSMGSLRFGVDTSGNYGYYGTDGSLIPFKGGGVSTLSGTYANFNQRSGRSSYTLQQTISEDGNYVVVTICNSYYGNSVSAYIGNSQINLSHISSLNAYSMIANTYISQPISCKANSVVKATFYPQFTESSSDTGYKDTATLAVLKLD